MACYDCFFVQSMPRASKQQARYAVGRCLMLWSSNDVTQQGSRPKTKLSLYGSVLIWVKSYLRESGRKLQLVGIDLPNTLNPRDDLAQLAEIIQVIDHLMKPHVDALTQLLTSIDGQSAVISSAKWGELETAQQEKAISGVTRLKLRLASLAPVLKNHVNSDFFRKASDRIESIEYTLETLRVMKAFFDGTSLEGDTSVRDSYMAGVVDGMVRANVSTTENQFISPMFIQTAFNFSSVVQRLVCRFSGLRLLALRWFVVFLASGPCVASASSYFFRSAVPPRWRCLFRSSCPSPNSSYPFWLLALTFRSSRPAFCGRLTSPVRKLDAWGFVGMGLIIAAFLLARSPSWKSLRRPTPW
jgi:hypothetical protein